MATLSQHFRDCSLYLAGYRNLSPETLSNYERTWSQFSAFLRSRGLNDDARHFTQENVMMWGEHLASMGIVANTICNKFHGLSTLARFLMKRKDGRGKALLAENPTLGFEKPTPATPETPFLYPEAMARFMDAPCSEGLHYARMLITDTGIRRGECVTALASDLSRLGEQWIITVSVKGHKQLKAAKETLPVSPQVAEELVEYLKRREAGPNDPLIASEGNTPFTKSQLTQAFIRLGKKAGIAISTSPHKFRHTANVHARLADIDPTVRARMLNHRGLRTLQRYDHVLPTEAFEGRAKQRASFETYLRLGREQVMSKSAK